MGTANTNLDPFQALSNEERAFLRAVEVLNNSFERRVYTLSANELVALLGGAKASQRRLEFLSNVLAVRDYAELEITTNYVMFGEDIDFNVQTLVAYKADDDSVEAFLVKETDSPPDYPNGLSSPDEIPPIVETLLENLSSSEEILLNSEVHLISSSTSVEMPPIVDESLLESSSSSEEILLNSEVDLICSSTLVEKPPASKRMRHT